MIPDHRGCDKGHEASEMSRVRGNMRDGQEWRWYCRACRRDQQSKRHYGGPRCYKRGHLKTPWTWVRYGIHWRCITCDNIGRQERKARVA